MQKKIECCVLYAIHFFNTHCVIIMTAELKNTKVRGRLDFFKLFSEYLCPILNSH